MHVNINVQHSCKILQNEHRPLMSLSARYGRVQRRWKKVWDGGKTTGCLGDESPPAVGDESPPAGSRGRAPVGGQGASSPEAEEFTSKLYAFFGSISHIFTYICFFRACRHHSTKSAKWGAFDTVCPLVCKWGATDPSAPSSAAYGGYGRERLL